MKPKPSASVVRALAALVLPLALLGACKKRVPEELAGEPLELADDGHLLVYTFDAQAERSGIATLLRRLGDLGIGFKDLHSSESSLEEIFVSLVHEDATGAKL